MEERGETKSQEREELREERKELREERKKLEELEELSGWEQAEFFLSVVKKYDSASVKEALRVVQPQMSIAFTRIGELQNIFDTAIKTWGQDAFTAIMQRMGYEPEVEVRVDRGDYGMIIPSHQLAFMDVTGKHDYTVYGTVKGARSPPVQEAWRYTMKEDGSVKFFFRSEQNPVNGPYLVKLKAGDRIIKEKRSGLEVEGRFEETEDLIRVVSGTGLQVAPTPIARPVTTIVSGPPAVVYIPPGRKR